MNLDDEKYMPYVNGKMVIVLYCRNGFAVRSNFNRGNKFKSLRGCLAFCAEQNKELLEREASNEL